jgi:hypothetical protein
MFLGSGTTRLGIFAHILGWKVGPGYYSADSAQKIISSLHFLTNQIKFFRFLAELAHFNDPELPVDRFSIVKKHFFINTNNVKDFLLQQRIVHGCKDPSNTHLTPNVVRVKCSDIFNYLDQYYSFYTPSLLKFEKFSTLRPRSIFVIFSWKVWVFQEMSPFSWRNLRVT